MECKRRARRNWNLVEVLAACIIGLLACCQGNKSPEEPCAGVSCSDHGACAVLDGEPVCLCDEGYDAEGLECVEAPLSPCSGVNCSDHGICEVRDGEPWCVCYEHFHNEGGTSCVPDDEGPCHGMTDGMPCDDGRYCTVNDACAGGACTGSTNPCDDGESCTADACNEADDACEHKPAPDGAQCDDGRHCTLAEICTGGVCGGGMPRYCSDADPCTEDSCDEENETCVNAVVPDGTPCDGAYCVLGEECMGGVCMGGRPRDCSDDNSCTIDYCDVDADTCVNTLLPDGSWCDDGIFCNVGEMCTAGACDGGRERPCSDGNSCSADFCDEDAVMCVNILIPDGTACDDGEFCTVGETCTAAICWGGGPRDCSDGDPCTTDSCDEWADACVHVLVPNPGADEICGNEADEDCSGFLDDRDMDGDGYFDADPACGGDDCDDMDPLFHPWAAEILDALDNDCNGLVDEGLIPVGAIVVTEIMHDPAAVDDGFGEWFEVTNVWSSPINLHSWEVGDVDADGFTVDQPAGIVVAPGESAVLCSNADPALNGGVACDYEYEDFFLESTSDEVILELGPEEIDRVEYVDSGPNGFPLVAGNSMSLDPASYDHVANDSGTNWCATPSDPAYQLPDGDHGTPGAVNPSCAGARE